MKRNQITTVVMATLLFLSVFAGAFAGSATADHGEDGVTEVSTAQGLADALNNSSDSTRHIELADNIDMAGQSYSPPTNMSGTIDGNGYTISNLSVNTSGQVGLVGTAGSGLTVKDVTFVDANVSNSGLGDAGIVIGSFVDGGSATVTNVEVQSSQVNAPDGNAGGIIGASDGSGFAASSVKISDVSVVIESTSSNRAGGVVGRAANTTIESASTDVSISGTVGGGGIVAEAIDNVTISESSAVGDVTSTESNSDVGGVVGYSLDTNISNTYADVNVSGTYRVGGVVGYLNTDSELSYSFAYGSVDNTTGNTAGGAVGDVNSATANQVFYDVNETGESTSAVGTGLTTSEMTGSDAVSTMNLPADTWYNTDSYPVLSSEQYSGTVYYENQTAFDGANVTLFDSNGSEIANLTTSSDGSWNYDGSADVDEIQISADGYYTSTIDDPSTVVSYETTLTEGSDGAGLAVIASYNDSGDAITQGKVSITGPSSAEAELDENGVASFSNLDAGNYTVTLSSEQIQEDVTAEVSVEAGQSETVSLSGKAYNTLTAEITDTSGEPIAGVTAELHKVENNSTTIYDTQISDENGTVVFENVPDGEFDVIWSVYDTEHVETVNVSDPANNELTVASSNDFKTGTFEVTIKQDESVFGGDPIENATVYVFAKDDTKVATITTNSNGVASTELATSDGYWFQPVADGYSTYHSKTDLDDGTTFQVYENQTTEYTAPLTPSLEPAPTLTVNTTVDGEPVEANVTITEQYIGNEVLNGTANNGTVEYLNPLSGGYYVINAEYTDNGTTYTGDTVYRVTENGTNTVNLALQSESAGGGGFFGDSGFGLFAVVLVGGVAYLIYKNSNGGNGGSSNGRSRKRSGEYART